LAGFGVTTEAWLSESAYHRIQDGNSNSCQTPESILGDEGWSRWPDFPDSKLLEKISRSHLRVEVWRNPSRAAVAVAFGGTVFKSGKDWKSNLRWFIPHHNDEYTQIVNEFGPAFVKEVVRREQEPEWAFLSNAKIYATGHSLGGGLAQQFAYSLPLDSRVPRVSKVFAFDPSPVTGFYSLPENTRNENSNGLEIDRIYERGEILALLRSLENFVYPASAINPKIRQVRYNLFSRRPISGHSMTDLACKLIEASR
jgi:hypothetical protein